MPVKVMKINELSQAGFTLRDGILHSRNGKLSTMLLRGDDGIITYLNTETQALFPNVADRAEIPLPNDFVILEISGDNGTFYQIGREKKKPARSDESRKPRADAPLSRIRNAGALPIEIGNSIHLKSKMGSYQVVYVSIDTILVTSKALAKEFAAGKVETPVESVSWGDYKCINYSGE